MHNTTAPFKLEKHKKSTESYVIEISRYLNLSKNTKRSETR